VSASGLDDFRSYFSQFIGLIVGGTAATALVLVTALIDLAPPWPPAVVQVTGVVQLVALIFVFQVMKTAGKARINRTMLRSVALLAVFLTAYLAAHSLLVFQMPDGSLGLRGLWCTANAYAVYEGSCPLLTRDEIADAEFTAGRLWTPLGLTAARMTMLLCWIGVFANLVFLIGSFAVYQRRVAARPAI
jgi:hypothetical protein